MGKKLTKNIFINRSKEIHNNEYEYSLVNYINSKTKVEFFCPIHGIFEQNPNYHLNGLGCKKCSMINLSIKLRKKHSKYYGEQHYKPINFFGGENS